MFIPSVYPKEFAINLHSDPPQLIKNLKRNSCTCILLASWYPHAGTVANNNIVLFIKNMYLTVFVLHFRTLYSCCGARGATHKDTVEPLLMDSPEMRTPSSLIRTFDQVTNFI